MKILFYVLGFIATCFLGFYVIGLVKPTVNYQNEITINRPIEQSWAVYSNEQLLSQWMQGFQRLEKQKLNPFDVGAEYKIILKEEGQEFELQYKVINCIPNQLYEFELSNPLLKNHVKIEFKSSQTYTTQIFSSNTVYANNWFLRSLFVFFKGQFKSQEELNLQALKKLVELDPSIAIQNENEEPSI